MQEYRSWSYLKLKKNKTKKPNDNQNQKQTKNNQPNNNKKNPQNKNHINLRRWICFAGGIKSRIQNMNQKIMLDIRNKWKFQIKGNTYFKKSEAADFFRECFSIFYWVIYGVLTLKSLLWRGCLQSGLLYFLHQNKGSCNTLIPLIPHGYSFSHNTVQL